jgi:molecular chaperone DnaJ
MHKDYFDMLGVSRDVTGEDLKKAYRRLALQHHPDRNPDNRDAEERFKEINEAYEVLSNPEKRMRYEQFGSADGNSAFDFGFGQNLDSMFNDLFSDFFGAQRQRARKGDDLRYNLEIEFEEAVFGVQKELEIPKVERCPSCNGSRAEPGHDPEACRYCGGRGQVRQAHGFFTINRTCDQCGGDGYIIKHPCTHCKGRGHVKTKRTIRVKVPPGVDSGSRLKVRGEGMQGFGDSHPGDLYVVLSVREHPFFSRDGDNILVRVPVGFPTLCLGGELTIPTIDGETRIGIPPGTQPGKVFRLQGFGVPSGNGRRRGDQLVYLDIAVPTDLSDRQRELLEELARISNEEAGTQNRGFADRVMDFFKS